jgi:hypothetical protein
LTLDTEVDPDILTPKPERLIAHSGGSNVDRRGSR